MPVTFSVLKRLYSEGGREMRGDVLERLYDRYYRPAYLYALSICRSRELAEDLVAEAFVKAYLTLADEHGSFQYWLLRVCKNLWIDQLRRQKRYDGGGRDAPPDIPDTYTPEHRVLEDERLSVLYGCIGSLRDADREVLTLHYFSRLPLREIALLLGATPGSVKTRLFRARQALKRLMEENGYEF
jgi:RNA polymerase sigma-70 factor (ECF subfamily)